MNDTKLLETVERYIRGEMKPDERLHFENLRKTNAEIDQLVVEHTLFLQQLNHYGERKSFKSSLNDIHTDLTEQGKIDSMRLKGRSKVVYLWKRYKRVATIAASIAGITTLTISALVWMLSPKPTDNLQGLNRELEGIKKEQQNQKAVVNNLKDQINTDKKAERKSIQFKSGGTGFLIDGKGYLVTNAHIIRNSINIAVFNNKGEEFNAVVLKTDNVKDIAILKIEDKGYKSIASLPYGISKTVSDVAEPIYTLGYPRNDIVYSEGYLSARTGFNGDTLSCQLGIAANRGNSGGPVFNHNGEVIGILSTKETESEGVAFAIQSKYIFDAIDQLKKDTIYQSLKLSSKSSVRGMNKQQQVQKIQDYVFMVKGD
ncbi:MAG: serine protease [Chitinophagaceae bacterium]|nr:serine protease [Chitinophagaceae bacterium]MBK9463555.1 serine protease [Chitinophagaceae bacterium]MBK9659324.1 serine protease [Chitinophagaceae bacterium]MBK9937150.1 serine protease [Chitinophagaceae bacterium]MBL0067773.1 serine protease [Chitinophagaceae bacterium]